MIAFAVFIGALVGVVGHLAAQAYSFRGTSAAGVFELEYRHQDAFGELVTLGTIGGHAMPVLVDTGYSGDVVLNETCVVAIARHYAGGGGAEGWNAYTYGEMEDLVINLEQCAACDVEQAGCAHCDTAAVQQTLTGVLGMRTGRAQSSVMMALSGIEARTHMPTRGDVRLRQAGGEHSWPDGGETVDMSVMRIDFSGVILTLDYLVRRGPVTISTTRGLRFEPPPGDALVPQQHVNGGVVMAEMHLPVLGRSVDLVVDTGFAGFVTLDLSIGQAIVAANAAGCGALVRGASDQPGALLQHDVHGSEVCTGGVMTSLQWRMDDGSLEDVNGGRTVAAYIGDGDVPGADGLIGMAALQEWELHFSRRFFAPHMRMTRNADAEDGAVISERLVHKLLQDNGACEPVLASLC